jgi:hypothetical protein
VIGSPSLFKLTHRAAALAKVLPIFALSCPRKAARLMWKVPRFDYKKNPAVFFFVLPAQLPKAEMEPGQRGSEPTRSAVFSSRRGSMAYDLLQVVRESASQVSLSRARARRPLSLSDSLSVCLSVRPSSPVSRSLFLSRQYEQSIQL